MIEIPIVGERVKDQFYDRLRSRAIAGNLLGGVPVEFILKGYVNDKSKVEFHEAIENFLSIDEEVKKCTRSYLPVLQR
jgi:hypothetical protein